MFNKLTRPSFALLLLLVTLVCAVLYIRWAVFEPFAYEKALTLEKKGHESFAAKKYAAAYKYFLDSATIQDRAPIVSRRYRCAASSAFQLGDVRNGVRLSSQALRFDTNNTLARQNIMKGLASGQVRPELIKKIDKNIVDVLFDGSPVLYVNRTHDGWSKGKKSTAIVYASGKCVADVDLLTAKPSREGVHVKVLVNKKIMPDILLQTGQKYSAGVDLAQGVNIITMEISHTFVPKDYNMNDDNRVLGVNYTVRMSCDE